VQSDTAPIRRRKLSDEVRKRLLDTINNGGLRPGDFLPSERELMSQFEVGRPAVREAMQALQSIGLIDVRHGERPRVAKPSLEHLFEQLALTMRHVLTFDAEKLEQLKEARLILETQMVRIAAEKRSVAQLAVLGDIIRRQASAVDDAHLFMQIDGEFHQAIGAISGNQLITSVLRAIFEWMARFHVDSVRRDGGEKLALKEHEDIIDAIAKADPELAASAMTDHLLRANSLYRQENDTSTD